MFSRMQYLGSLVIFLGANEQMARLDWKGIILLFSLSNFDSFFSTDDRVTDAGPADLSTIVAGTEGDSSVRESVGRPLA